MRRPWPQFIERRGKQFRIVWCESVLEVREALAEIEETADAKLLLITNLDESLLGADVVARFPRGRLMAASRWDALRAAFSARDLDPRLRGQDWLSDLLLERPPVAGYPPVPGGVLDLDTAWHSCLEHAVGLLDARPGVGALLAWTAGEGNLDRFEALSQATRDKILEKVANEGGSAAALVARAVSAGHGPTRSQLGWSAVWSSRGPERATAYAMQLCGWSQRSAGARLHPMPGACWPTPQAALLRGSMAPQHKDIRSGHTFGWRRFARRNTPG